MRGGNRPDARSGLIELVQIRGARLHRIERAAQHPDDEIEAAVAVQVAGRGRVVAARLERRSWWKWNPVAVEIGMAARDRKSTRLNSSHDQISYAVFCLKKKKNYRANHLLCESRCVDNAVLAVLSI